LENLIRNYRVVVCLVFNALYGLLHFLTP